MAIQPIDIPCHSVRDFLAVIAAVRVLKARDPLRALEDHLIDTCAEAGRPE